MLQSVNFFYSPQICSIKKNPLWSETTIPYFCKCEIYRDKCLKLKRAYFISLSNLSTWMIELCSVFFDLNRQKFYHQYKNRLKCRQKYPICMFHEMYLISLATKHVKSHQLYINQNWHSNQTSHVQCIYSPTDLRKNHILVCIFQY